MARIKGTTISAPARMPARIITSIPSITTTLKAFLLADKNISFPREDV
ncbi:hypothetical protein ACQK5W_00765 [Pantoea sp. FN060301]